LPFPSFPPFPPFRPSLLTPILPSLHPICLRSPALGSQTSKKNALRSLPLDRNRTFLRNQNKASGQYFLNSKRSLSPPKHLRQVRQGTWERKFRYCF
jgi:hypothetical protein